MLSSRCRICLLLGLSLMVVNLGCSASHRTEPNNASTGLILIIPGVEGGEWQLTWMKQGLREAAITDEIDVITWGVGPFGSLFNLMDIDGNRRRAAEYGRRIERHHSQHPDQPITLIGYSGGGGLAVMTVEALKNRDVLDRLILIAAAISPDYPVDKLVPKCRRGVVSFRSRHDWFTLGVGTRLFGTIDRKNVDSAGRVGFLDDKGSLLCCDGLDQVDWCADWQKLGHGGGHVGWLSSAWARDVLAPQITSTRTAKINPTAPARD